MSNLLTMAETAAIVPLLDSAPACENCGNPFEPRKGSGGKPQRFCSHECWQAYHASDKPNVFQCAQRATLETPIAATAQPKTENDAPAVTPADEEDFHWTDDESIVLREQPATAIYINRDGSIAIRQERMWNEDEDSFVFVRPQNAIAFAKQFLKVAGYGDVEFSQHAGGGFVDLK